MPSDDVFTRAVELAPKVLPPAIAGLIVARIKYGIDRKVQTEFAEAVLSLAAPSPAVATQTTRGPTLCDADYAKLLELLRVAYIARVGEGLSSVGIEAMVDALISAGWVRGPRGSARG